ncbi:hypothetical protein HDU93_006617 [Gonapodya sp. JEL0774]|nr:hypothetical protein HDU93_006617 [Gonapodya sp. JEL0774]
MELTFNHRPFPFSKKTEVAFAEDDDPRVVDGVKCKVIATDSISQVFCTPDGRLNLRAPFLPSDFAEQCGFHRSALTAEIPQYVVDGSTADPTSPSYWTTQLNDCRVGEVWKEARDSSRDMKENAQIIETHIYGFPFLFVVALKDIVPGDELLIDYSDGYWREMQAIHRHDATLSELARRDGDRCLTNAKAFENSLDPVRHLLQRYGDTPAQRGGIPVQFREAAKELVRDVENMVKDMMGKAGTKLDQWREDMEDITGGSWKDNQTTKKQGSEAVTDAAAAQASDPPSILSLLSTDNLSLPGHMDDTVDMPSDEDDDSSDLLITDSEEEPLKEGNSDAEAVSRDPEIAELQNSSRLPSEMAPCPAFFGEHAHDPALGRAVRDDSTRHNSADTVTSLAPFGHPHWPRKRKRSEQRVGTLVDTDFHAKRSSPSPSTVIIYQPTDPSALVVDSENSNLRAGDTRAEFSRIASQPHKSPSLNAHAAPLSRDGRSAEMNGATSVPNSSPDTETNASEVEQLEPGFLQHANNVNDDKIIDVDALPENEEQGALGQSPGDLRFVLVEWLADIANEYKQCSTTLHRSIDLLDRYLSLRRVPRRELQVVGIVALWIASKFEESPKRVISISVVEDLCCQWYTRSDLRQMEITMLTTLDFVVDRPTADIFVHTFAAKLGLLDSVLHCQLEPGEIARARQIRRREEIKLWDILEMALSLAKTALLYEEFIGSLRSTIALASLQIAGSAFGLGLSQPFADPAVVAQVSSKLSVIQRSQHSIPHATLPEPLSPATTNPSDPASPSRGSRRLSSDFSTVSSMSSMLLDVPQPARQSHRRRHSWFMGHQPSPSARPIDPGEAVPGSGLQGMDTTYAPLSPPPTPQEWQIAGTWKPSLPRSGGYREIQVNLDMTTPGDAVGRLMALLSPPSDGSVPLAWMRSTAHELTHSWLLTVASTSKSEQGDSSTLHLFRLAELEFYWNHPTDHPDPFSHKNPDQALPMRWYFHKQGRSFRGGTWKGLDITFGGSRCGAVDETSDASGVDSAVGSTWFGGILIRSLEAYGTIEFGVGGVAPSFTTTPTVSQSLVEGPSTCVEHLLDILKSRSVQHLVDTYLSGHNPPMIQVSYPSPHSLMLLPTSSFQAYSMASPPHVTLTSGPRVGLTLPASKSESDSLLLLRARYLSAPYRFLLRPAATKKGRPHVALGAMWSRSMDLDVPACVKHTVPIVGGHSGTLKAWFEAFAEARSRARGKQLVDQSGEPDLSDREEQKPLKKKRKLDVGLSVVRNFVGKPPSRGIDVCEMIGACVGAVEYEDLHAD